MKHVLITIPDNYSTATVNFMTKALKDEGFWAIILPLKNDVQVFGLDTLPQADLDAVKRIVLANKGHIPE